MSRFPAYFNNPSSGAVSPPDDAEQALHELQNPAQNQGEGSVYNDMAISGTDSASTESGIRDLSSSSGHDLHGRITTEIGKMRQVLGTLQQNSDSQNGKSAFNLMQNVTQSLQELQKHQDASLSPFGEIITELRSVHHDINSLTSREQTGSDCEEILSRIQDSYEEVSGKLDAPGRSQTGNHIEVLEKKLRIIEKAVLTSNIQELSGIEDQLQTLTFTINSLINNDVVNESDISNETFVKCFEGLDGKMDEIARAVLASATNSNCSSLKDALDRIEARVTSLAKSVETDFPTETRYASMVPLLTNLTQMPEQIESALFRLEEQIAQLSVSENFDRESVNKEFGYQLSSIAQQIDQLQQVSGDTPLSESENAGIIKKLDSLSLAIKQATDNENNSRKQLESQMTELSSRVEQALEVSPGKPENHSSSDSLLAKELQALVPHIEALVLKQASAKSHERQLSNLEDQISGISSQLQSCGGQVVDLKAIEVKLAVVEERFLTDREQLTLLSTELKSHNTENFSSVIDSLSMILNRFTDIEKYIANEKSSSRRVRSVPSVYNEIQPRNNEMNTDSEHNDLARQTDNAQFEKPDENSVSNAISHASAMPLPASSVASDQSTPLQGARQENLTGGSLLLEPGSGAPDIENNSLQINPVSQEKQNIHEKKNNSVDFVAAARRAAQKAEYDSEVSNNKYPEKKSGFSLKKFFSSGKKSAALGIVIVALGTLSLPTLQDFYFSATPQTRMSEQMSSNIHTQPPKYASLEKKLPGSHSELPPMQVASLTGASKLISSTPAFNKESQNNIFLKHEAPTSINNMVMPAMKVSPSTTDETSGKIETKTISRLSEIIAPVALRQAALENDPKAFFEIARRYAIGVNGNPDFKEAIKWHRLSASFNYAPAQQQLGLLYEKGYGVASDMKKATDWYARAANQGNALAMHNLAVGNAMGLFKGGANMKNALFWFSKAAERGIRDSQVNLGIIYAKGIGVKRDLEKSYKWFAIAARGNDKDAAQKRDIVAKKISLDQLKKVNEEIRRWEAKELNAQANMSDVPKEWRTIQSVPSAGSINAKIIREAQANLVRWIE